MLPIILPRTFTRRPFGRNASIDEARLDKAVSPDAPGSQASRHHASCHSISPYKVHTHTALFLIAALCVWPFAAYPRTSQRTAAPPASQNQQAPAPDANRDANSPAARSKPITREAAARESWTILQDSLAEKSSDRRASVISALGTIGLRRDVVKLVESGLHDKTLEVRQIAAATLGAMKSRSSIPQLRVALDDPSAAVDFTAAQALWSMGDRSGESIFIQVLAGERKASPGIFHTQWHDMQEKLHDPRGLAEFGAAETAGAFLGPGGFGVTVIEELARDKTSATRAISARALATDTSASSREALLQALGEKSWLVRASAAAALAQHGAARDIDKLSPLLTDNRAEVRYSAAAAIVRLSPRVHAPIANPHSPGQ